jgi:putative transposase
MKQRQTLVKSSHEKLSKRCRARLLAINLSSCYHQPKPLDADTVTLMNEIRDLYARRPFQGYRRITWDLKDLGYRINHKKVYRLMQIMGLQAVYPKKNLSKRNHDHKVYPYLLKQFPPLKPHDVWCTDISYIKTATGYVYLTALIDVVSRCVMGWHVSTSLETESCLRALEKAIETGYKPIIINSDQGCQYTSQEWVYQLSLLGVKVSMDGKGRWLDNIPVERLWRTIKYEEVYLRTYETVTEAKQFLEVYINWYNHQRRHSGINYQRPYEVMTGKAQATSWPFQQQKNEQIPGYGYVDNVNTLSHIPTSPTTTTKQQKEKMMMDLSSKIAA